MPNLLVRLMTPTLHRRQASEGLYYPVAMKRLLRFVLLFVVILGFVPFLPLYIERTMMRSWRVDHAGDVIEWGWKVRTLNAFWSDYSYMRPEQKPALWLTVNTSLALVYALVVATGVDQLLKRRLRREAVVSQD